MLALLDEMPSRVSCQGGAYLNRDVVRRHLEPLRFPERRAGAHLRELAASRSRSRRLVVVGSEKMAVFDDTAEHKLVLYPHRSNGRTAIPTAVKAEAEVVTLDERRAAARPSASISSTASRPERPRSATAPKDCRVLARSRCLPARAAQQRGQIETLRTARRSEPSAPTSCMNPPMSTTAPRSAPARRSGTSRTS